jgi:putative nucleotidyltransferase with HDIG domain
MPICLKMPTCSVMCNVSRKPPAEMPAKLASVPAFPSVAMKLLSLLADGESSFSSIAGCIAADPVLSGRLIERANAADQTRYCAARNVLQAVVSLGVDRTREISLAIATSVYAGSAIKTEIFRPCWHHTLASALAASEIARQLGLSPAEPYTAALLHDIGRLALLAAYPAEYEKVMAQAIGQQEDLVGIEREHFGVDHVEVGRWLAMQWRLPESIVEVIARHHEAPTKALDQVTVVQVACRLADLLGFGVNRPSEPPKFEEICASLPEWARMRIGAQLRTIQDAIKREIRLLEGSDASPSESSSAVVENEERNEAPSAASSLQDVPAEATSLLFSRGMMVGTLVGAVVLLISGAAAYIQH